ncbi:MAG: HAD-IB family hydrolase [Acidimicrobiales bacterium]|nr:HAD-IB family hydrolase [Acidimicrobiales bacterium]
MNPTHVPDPVRAVAAFDFDGTLTHGDTMLPFLRRVAGSRRVVQGLAAAAWTGRRRNEHGREAAKRALLRVTLEGVPNVELMSIGRTYADHIIGAELRPALVARLGEHRAAGHRVVIVSASLDYYLEPVAAYLGVELICCRLGSYASGRCNGTLGHPNIRGEVKAERLRDLLGAPLPTVYAYGNDPIGDAGLLELADHPYLMRESGFAPIDAALDDERPRHSLR